MFSTSTRVCSMCGGFGRDGGCPKCGLTIRNAAAEKAFRLDVPADVIPVSYHGKLWEKPDDSNLLIRFKEFDASLDKVMKQFMMGKIPNFSMFISAPPKYGKQKFAYSCLQLALVQKFSIAPLFSTADWRRLYRVSQVNPFYKLFGKYQWDTLICVDALFISVDHSDDRFDVIGLMKDILDERSRFSKSTFFISDYKLEDLVPHWGGDTYNMIFNTDTNRDYARYPVIMQRFSGEER